MKQPYICKNCREPSNRYPRTLLCGSCYAYRNRTGRERPAELYSPTPRRCTHCQRLLRRLGAAGECPTCHTWRLRHAGAPRPLTLVTARRCAISPTGSYAVPLTLHLAVRRDYVKSFGTWSLLRLSRLHGVGRTTIRRMLNGTHWTCVETGHRRDLTKIAPSAYNIETAENLILADRAASGAY